MEHSQSTLLALAAIAVVSAYASANFSGRGKHAKRVLLLVADAIAVLHISGAVDVIALIMKAAAAF